MKETAEGGCPCDEQVGGGNILFYTPQIGDVQNSLRDIYVAATAADLFLKSRRGSGGLHAEGHASVSLADPTHKIVEPREMMSELVTRYNIQNEDDYVYAHVVSALFGWMMESFATAFSLDPRLEKAVYSSRKELAALKSATPPPFRKR